MECVHRGTSESDAEAQALFEKSLELDPNYARAYGGLSLSHFNEWSCQAWQDWDRRESLAYDYAARAQELDPNDATVHLILGKIEQYRRHFERAESHMRRAYQLASNDANVLIQLAACHAYHGTAAFGLELAERALALNPLGPGWFFCYIALPLFALRRYRQSLDYASKAPPRMLVDLPAYQAASWAYLEDQRQAAASLAEFRSDFHLRIACGRSATDSELMRWLAHVNPYRSEEDSQHLEEGLRRAGLGGVAKAPPLMPVPWPIGNTFRREGKQWVLAFDSQVAQMPELRGFLDIARLIERPGEEVHCSELAGVAPGAESGIEILDQSARLAYRQRLEAIEEEWETAVQLEDADRAAQLEGEREAILSELKRATGLGGRIRAKGSSDERCRSAVTWRIRHAIRKIEESHRSLGRHLSRSIRTGAFCVYEPERPQVWRL